MKEYETVSIEKIDEIIEKREPLLITTNQQNDIKEAINTVLQHVKHLQKENQELKNERNGYRAQVNSAFDNGFIHKDKIREMIEELNAENEYDTECVKDYEAMRRKTINDFYRKSYQTSIHKLNAKRELRNQIIGKLQDLLNEE